jgi:hypothetical protein
MAAQRISGECSGAERARGSRVSRARYTSPIRPALIGARIS